MLTLPIKAKWFEMIRSGKKKEEYRRLCPYYEKRFRNLGLFVPNQSALLQFRNGYSAQSPSFIAEVKLTIGYGRTEWGAVSGEKYFILSIFKLNPISEMLKSIEINH